jgi:hypothetical protein
MRGKKILVRCFLAAFKAFRMPYQGISYRNVRGSESTGRLVDLKVVPAGVGGIVNKSFDLYVRSFKDDGPAPFGW